MLDCQAPNIEKLANIRDNINDKTPINPDTQSETAKYVRYHIRTTAKNTRPSKHILPKLFLQERAQSVEGPCKDWK